MASFTSDTQDGKRLPIGIISAEQRDREDRDWQRSKELAAARLAGKIEGMIWAADFCENIAEPHIAKTIRDAITELEATTTQKTEE